MKYFVKFSAFLFLTIFLSACNQSTQSLSNNETTTITNVEEGKSAEPEVQKEKRYRVYSEADYNTNTDKQRILFFHATWCPTCKAANTEIEQRITEIPKDVIVYKTDYDSEKELKNKYAITYQHTYVLVDKDGKEITKWNGGDIDEILEKI